MVRRGVNYFTWPPPVPTLMATATAVLLGLSVLLPVASRTRGSESARLGRTSWESGVRLDGSRTSYAQFSTWDVCPNASLSFQFRTRHPTALLVYSDDGQRRFVDVRLVGGRLRLRYRLSTFAKHDTLTTAGLHHDDVPRSPLNWFKSLSVSNLAAVSRPRMYLILLCSPRFFVVYSTPFSTLISSLSFNPSMVALHLGSGFLAKLVQILHLSSAHLSSLYLFLQCSPRLCSQTDDRRRRSGRRSVAHRSSTIPRRSATVRGRRRRSFRLGRRRAAAGACRGGGGGGRDGAADDGDVRGRSAGDGLSSSARAGRADRRVRAPPRRRGASRPPVALWPVCRREPGHAGRRAWNEPG